MKTVEHIRRENLALLVSRHETVTALATVLEKAESQISQWLNASIDFKTQKPRNMHAKSARTIETKLKLSKLWMDTDHSKDSHEGHQELVLSSEERALIEDWRAIPAGWRFYLSKRADELRRCSDAMPPFLKDRFKVIPDDSTYWDFESGLEEYLKRSRKTGPDGDFSERRHQDVPVNHDRRSSYKPKQPMDGDASAPTTPGRLKRQK